MDDGCGKSSTGRVISELLEPRSGEISFTGRDIAGLKPREMKSYRSGGTAFFPLGLPSPSNPPSGCVFHTRCRTYAPALEEKSPGRQVNCHCAAVRLCGFAASRAGLTALLKTVPQKILDELIVPLQFVGRFAGLLSQEDRPRDIRGKERLERIRHREHRGGEGDARPGGGSEPGGLRPV